MVMLNDTVTLVDGSLALVQGRLGEVQGDSHGLYYGPLRLVNAVTAEIDGQGVAPLALHRTGPATASLVGLSLAGGGAGMRPGILVERERSLGPGVLEERCSLVSQLDQARSAQLRVQVGLDFGPIQGEQAPPGEFQAQGFAGVGGHGLTVAGPGGSVWVQAPGAEVRYRADLHAIELMWQLDLAAAGRAQATWRLMSTLNPPPAPPATWPGATIQARDAQLATWFTTALEDLEALTHPGGGAAPLDLEGSPCAALWVATHQAPWNLGPAKAALSRPLAGDDVEAQAVWLICLRQAWAWGMSPGLVSGLLDRAQAHMEAIAAAAPDGLVLSPAEPAGPVPRQWRDVSGAIRFVDGRPAVGPFTLTAVQGLAHRAAVAAVELFDAFGSDAGNRWEAWAQQLAEAFRERMWADDGSHPILALDGDGRAVTTLSADIGHLLGHGMLTEAESQRVAAALVGSGLSAGLGLRSVAVGQGGYGPLDGGTGAVWPHQTAVAVDNLRLAGFDDAADQLIRGLLAAAAGFEGRLPQFYAGVGGTIALPHPAACPVDALSAATALAVVTAAIGLQPTPEGPALAPIPASQVARVSLTGIIMADQAYRVDSWPSGAPGSRWRVVPQD
jgi:hypothetical protein